MSCMCLDVCGNLKTFIDVQIGLPRSSKIPHCMLSKANPIMENRSWDSLDIHPELKKIVKNEFKFDCMTPVQAASIPLFITNKDLIVQAVTGSGKTLAFVIPILQILLKKLSQNETLRPHDIGAIVVSPTRELATQIYEVFKKFTENLTVFQFKLMLLIGGTNPFKDIKSYIANGANIVVSTPGRLYDLLEKCENFSTRVRKCLEVFVLDEADQLLSLGFEKTLNNVIVYLPKLRRTSLFSATQTKDLEQLIRAGLRNPVNVDIKEKNPKTKSIENRSNVQMPERLVNHYLVVDSCEDKIPFLVEFIRKHQNEKFIVFMSTCAQVNFLDQILQHFLNKKDGFPVLKLHRKLKNQRQRIYDQFRETSRCILLCTDVISRGVDIPQVDWVIHFDLPLTIENYVHRCGRSAHQAGTYGNSLLLCLSHELPFVEACRSKGIKIKEFEDELNLDASVKEPIFKWIKSEAKRNVNFYELSMQAFVSFIRTYCSKQIMAKRLFKECDVVDIANGYGLLTMPKMPEFRQAKPNCDTKFKENKGDAKAVKNFKEILFKKKKSKQDLIQEDETVKPKPFGFKRNPILSQRLQKAKKKLKGRSKRHFFDEMDLQELNDDARMVRRLKKRKISNKEFDQHFGF